MKDNAISNRYIVDEQILPEAIQKTAQTKELLAKFPGLTINEAVKQIGLSRSAFYKYRDGIFPFYEAVKEKIVTIQINMENQAGVLSSCLNVVADSGANIMTINQGIPIEGIARAPIGIAGSMFLPISAGSTSTWMMKLSGAKRFGALMIRSSKRVPTARITSD